MDGSGAAPRLASDDAEPDPTAAAAASAAAGAAGCWTARSPECAEDGDVRPDSGWTSRRISWPTPCRGIAKQYAGMKIQSVV